MKSLLTLRYGKLILLIAIPFFLFSSCSSNSGGLGGGGPITPNPTPANLSASVGSISPIIYDGRQNPISRATVTLSISGGTLPYTVMLDGVTVGNPFQTDTILSTTPLSVKVTDAKGASVSLSPTVTVTMSPLVALLKGWWENTERYYMASGETSWTQEVIPPIVQGDVYRFRPNGISNRFKLPNITVPTGNLHWYLQDSVIHGWGDSKKIMSTSTQDRLETIYVDVGGTSHRFVYIRKNFAE